MLFKRAAKKMFIHSELEPAYIKINYDNYEISNLTV